MQQCVFVYCGFLRDRLLFPSTNVFNKSMLPFFYFSNLVSYVVLMFHVV